MLEERPHLSGVIEAESQETLGECLEQGFLLEVLVDGASAADAVAQGGAAQNAARPDTDRRQWLASASIMHVPTGLFVSGGYDNYDFRGINGNERFGGVAGVGPSRPDIPLWWVDAGRLGQRHSTASGAGSTTARSGCWRPPPIRTSGLVAQACSWRALWCSTARFSGGAPVWCKSIDAAAMDLHIAYRHYEADAVVSGGPDNQIPGGLNGIWFIQAGARIQF